MRRIVFSVMLTALLFACRPGWAQKTYRTSTHAGVFGVSSDLVLINVSVLDEQGRPIRGLSRQNFRVFEKRSPQTIISFNEEETPVSIVFVVDESGSMGEGVHRCAEAIKLMLENAGPEDEFALITFASRPVVRLQFTRDSGVLQARLLESQSRGRTALLDAIHVAESVAARARNDRRIIVVLSDGKDNFSRYGETDIIDSLAESRLQVYAIKVESPAGADEVFPEMAQRSGILDRICETVGGRTIEVDPAFGSIAEAMVELGEEIRSQYVLGYRPSRLARDNKFHPVRVKVSPPKPIRRVSLLWRRGYYDRAGF